MLASLILTGCSDGPMQTRSEDVSGFNRIRIETFGEIILQQGDQESLTIEAPRDYLRYITTEVRDETLVIGTRRGFVGGPVRRVVFTITVKNLEEFTLSGAGAVKAYALESDTLTVTLTGAGSIEIDSLSAERLTVNLTSAGAIVIAGQVDQQNINLSGVGSYEAGDLRTEETSINLSGAGSAVVWVEDYLDVNVSGVGSVSYFGRDPVVRQNVTGLGSVNSKGER
jgi:hypothetical protein